MTHLQYKHADKLLNVEASDFALKLAGIEGEAVEVVESGDLTEMEFDALLEHFRRMMDGPQA